MWLFSSKGLYHSCSSTLARFLYVLEEELSQTCPAWAFVPNARAEFVSIFEIGYRRSVERKLFSRKSGLTTSARNQALPSPECGSMLAGGCLLEWQPAQFSAKMILPRVITASSLVISSLPPGASLRWNGCSLRKKAAISPRRSSVARQKTEFF